MAHEKRTAQQALRVATQQLKEAGIERARVEAELLLSHAMGVGRLGLLADPDQVLSPEAEARFMAMVARRSERYPLPYLIGEREFMGLRFHVDEGVLIPRPETEVLAEAAIALLRRWEKERAEGGAPLSQWVVVDVGTGSGVIAVSLAYYVPSVRVYATDISPRACAIAQENAQRWGVADRVEVWQGDLLHPLREVCGPGVPCHSRASVICANLPYIPEENMSLLQAEVRDWEPRVALSGGPGGLCLIERLLDQAPSYLQPGGHLFCEIGPEADQPRRLMALLAQNPIWRGVHILPDLAGLPRVLTATACQEV